MSGTPQKLSAFRNVIALALGLCVVGLCSGCASSEITTTAAAAKTAAATENIGTDALYELRTYTTNDGKLDALHARFRDHTRRLFEKHGMQNVAYWTPTDKPNTLVYIVAHKNKEAAKASWAAFVADPEWRAVYAASIADGRLVANIDNLFMQATDYSPKL